MHGFKGFALSMACVFVVSGCVNLPLQTDTLAKPTLPVITKIDLPVASDKPQSKGDVYYDPNRTNINIYDTKGHEGERFGKHFTIRDFSHTGDIAFRYARLDPQLATCLNELRNQIGRPISINSAYRSWGYNEQLIKEGQKASRKSFHLSGKAADVYVSRIGVAELAKFIYNTCGCGTGFGVAQNWFHIDTRGRSVRPWGYANTSALRLSTARQVHKSICGGGSNDLNEMGQKIVSGVSNTFKKIKEKLSGIIK